MTYIKLLGQKESQDLDKDLLETLGFLNEQLMELAGLSVAESIARSFPKEKYQRILVIVGPGNNGGDGMVASRHLSLFGYSPKILYPKRNQKFPFPSLESQSKSMGIQILDEMPELASLNSEFDLVLDSIFGYSFSGEVRDPFGKIIQILKEVKIPIASVDIPSGWDVEKGNIRDGFIPQLLVSLTAPKICAKDFQGTHYLGGRFIPKSIEEKYQLNLPEYLGTSQCVLIDTFRPKL